MTIENHEAPRLKIFSNTAISLDGRINTREGTFTSLGSERDLQRMSELRDRADAVLVGGATFRNWPHPSLPDPQHLRHPPRAAALWNVIVSRQLEVPLLPAFLAERRVLPLFLTLASALAAARDPAWSEVEIEAYEGPGPDLPIPWIVEALQRRGVRSLLVEAGGDLLFQFLEADLLDEINVTVCPMIIGGRGVSSLADGRGFNLRELRRLRLATTEVQGDEIFLTYQRAR